MFISVTTYSGRKKWIDRKYVHVYASSTLIHHLQKKGNENRRIWTLNPLKEDNFCTKKEDR